MKILYLHQYFTTPEMPSDVSGVRSYELARRLVERGHEVIMITACRQGGMWRKSYVNKHAGIEVHWIPCPYSNNMSSIRRVIAFLYFAVLASWKSWWLSGDVVFATSTPLTIAIPAFFGRRFGRRPMVFEVRDIWPDAAIEAGGLKGSTAIAAARKLERFAYCNATEIVALAPGMAATVRERSSNEKQISVIPNGCDLYMFEKSDTSVREKFDWLGPRPLVVYAGTLGYVNGATYLPELARAMERRSPEVRFVIIGDGKKRSEVENRARQLGVLEKSFFMIGRVPKVEVKDWVLASDMTLSLILNREVFWKNAVTNKFFDSLAAGRPIANNHPGWQTEIAIKEGVGLKLPAEDFDKAAEHLWKHLSDSGWLERAGARARKLAETTFNRDVHAAQLEAVLSRCVGDREPIVKDETVQGIR